MIVKSFYWDSAPHHSTTLNRLGLRDSWILYSEQHGTVACMDEQSPSSFTGSS